MAKAFPRPIRLGRRLFLQQGLSLGASTLFPGAVVAASAHGLHDADAVGWLPVPAITLQPGDTFDIGRYYRPPPGTTTTFALDPGSAPLPPGLRLDSATALLHADWNASPAAVDSIVVAANSIPGPAQVETARLVQLVDSAEGPNWTEANHVLAAPWSRPGGDFSDAQKAAHGPVAFATARITNYAVQTLSWSIAPLVQDLLARNTGIFIKVDGGGGWIKFASRENAGHAPPALHVVTTAGRFEPPLLADTYLAKFSTSLGGAGFLEVPTLLKFDLSGVTGTVESATLTMTSFAQGALNSLVLGVYCLEMPRIIVNPATELGGVEQGIAASVARNDLDLRRHPNVLVYNEMSSHDEIWNDQWSVIVRRGARGGIPGHVAGDWTLDPRYVPWPEYGLTAGQVTIMGDPGKITMAGTVMHHWVTPKHDPPWPWQRDQGSGYDEIYCRYLVYLDPDVAKGVIPGGGVKLPGLAGTYGMDNADHYPAGRSAWSYRMEHFGPSPAHPGIFRLFIYAYDWTNPIGTGSGQPLLSREIACLAAGKKYCIEQYVKLNTQAIDGSWNSDGIVRVWVDGVRLFDISNRLIRKDAKVQIQSIPFLNFYHGGMQAPNADIHYQVTGICAATEYIGPPRRIA